MACKIHVAIIGAGYWGSKLIYEYLQLTKLRDDVKLVAIADISKERLLSIAQKYNLPSNMLITDPELIAKREDIHAVHIATPNETHYYLASLMLEHDKHVLLEKPMALSSRDAFKLVRLAEVKRRVLLVGHIFRFNNALRFLKKYLQEIDTHNIYSIDLVWSALLNPLPQNRDVIFDLAPHPIDIINYILEEWPIEVYTVAESPVRKQEGLEELAYSLLRLPNDVLVSIKLSWLEHGPKKRHIIISTKYNTIFVDALEQSVKIFSNDNTQSIRIEPSNTILEMINHFIDTITRDDAPNNSALIGALTVTVLEAMRKSLKENRPIKIF